MECRRGGESRIAPTTAGHEPVPQHHVGAEGPAEQPDVGEPATRRLDRPRPRGRAPRPPRSRTRPRWCPAALVVPRVLNRSTATSASAGSRHDALRSTWLSIIPPWVGSGCRQTSVATGGAVLRAGQLADQPQAVGGRAASAAPAGPGRIVLARISTSWPPSCALLVAHRRGCPRGHARRPARRCASAAGPRGCPHVGRPGHDVRGRRPDLLVAAGAAVRLRRRGAGDAAHDPVAVGVLLDDLRSHRRGRTASGSSRRREFLRDTRRSAAVRLRSSRGSRGRSCVRGSPR